MNVMLALMFNSGESNACDTCMMMYAGPRAGTHGTTQAGNGTGRTSQWLERG